MKKSSFFTIPVIIGLILFALIINLVGTEGIVLPAEDIGSPAKSTKPRKDSLSWVSSGDRVSLQEEAFAGTEIGTKTLEGIPGPAEATVHEPWWQMLPAYETFLAIFGCLYFVFVLQVISRFVEGK